jgi:hypothetical protein
MVNTTALSFSKPPLTGVGLLKPQYVLKQGKQLSLCVYLPVVVCPVSYACPCGEVASCDACIAVLMY